MLKAFITISLITWLIRSGSLEISKLKILLESPKVLAVTCLTWLTMAVGLATLRWRILLRAVGAEVALPRATALQVTALFFNGIVPGNVGGDFLKNQFVLGNQGAKLVVMVLAERTVGLISLVWAGGLGVLLSFRKIQDHSELMPLVWATSALVIGSVVGPVVLLFLLKKAGQQTHQTSSLPATGVINTIRRTLNSAIEAFQLIRSSKGAVTKGLLVSFLMHLGNLTYFLFLTHELGNPGAQFSEIAMVFPLGMLTLVLPISISGLGVGHVMFNELFEILGLTGGATIFNVYIVAVLAPCLLGAIPYMFMRRRTASSGSAA